MKSVIDQFVDFYWKRFSSCCSEEDYANLLSEIYLKARTAPIELPVLAAVSQVWQESPLTLDKFIRLSGSSPVGMLYGSIRQKLKAMSQEELDALKQSIKPHQPVWLVCK